MALGSPCDPTSGNIREMSTSLLQCMAHRPSHNRNMKGTFRHTSTGVRMMHTMCMFQLLWCIIPWPFYRGISYRKFPGWAARGSSARRDELVCDSLETHDTRLKRILTNYRTFFVSSANRWDGERGGVKGEETLRMKVNDRARTFISGQVAAG
jgi:hypothetical protein